MNNRKRLFILNVINWRMILGVITLIITFSYLYKSKFYVDANNIYSIYSHIDVLNLKNINFRDGFTITAYIYKILSLNINLSFEFLILFCSIIYFITYILIVNYIRIDKNLKFFFVFNFIYCFDIVYLCQPSKDYFALIFSILFLICLKNKNKSKRTFSIIIITLIFSILIRQYYLLILALYFFIDIIIKNKNKTLNIIILVLMALLILICFFNNGVFSNFINYKIYIKNEFSLIANTTIVDIIPYDNQMNIIKIILNCLINFIRLLFPFELLKMSVSRAIIFIPIQVFFSILIIKKIKMQIKNRFNYNFEKQILIYIISFYLVSGIFEPDFGSFSRHSVALMPMYIILLFKNT